MKINFNLIATLTSYAKMIISDIGIISFVSLLIGLTLPKKKTTKTALLITAGSSIIYFFGLINVERVYAIYDHLPSRFLVVMYPSVAIAIICLGILAKDFIFSKFILLKKNSTIFNFSVLSLLIFLLSYSILNQTKHFLHENMTIDSQVEGVLWSKDIRSICNEYQIGAVVRHEGSRNWGIRSFPLVCKQKLRSIDLNSETAMVYANEGVISGYKIDLPELVEHKAMFLDAYPTFIYTAKNDVELPLEEIFKNREKYQ